MNDILGTAALIGSIAVIVALLFLAPKGFQLGEPSPIIATADASH